MTKRSVLEVAGALVLAYLWLGWCHDPLVRQRERDRQEVAQTDSVARATDSLRVQMAYRESVAVAEIRRLAQRDTQLRREIEVLRGRIVPHSDTLPHFVIEQLAARDTLIRTQDSVIAQLDSSVTLWRGLAEERGTLIDRLTAERDRYREHMLAFQKRAEPGILESARRGLPYVALGFILASVVD